MDKVSLHDHLVETGFARSDLLYEYWHCTGTLITTINNPHDISVGDIIRYSSQVIMPMILAQKEGYVGGFTENGVMEWPLSVAERFREFGGEVRLNTRVTRIAMEDGRVTGSRRADGGRRGGGTPGRRGGVQRPHPDALQLRGRSGLSRRFRQAGYAASTATEASAPTWASPTWWCRTSTPGA